MEGRVPGLVGHMLPRLSAIVEPASVRDTDHVDIFLKEFREFEKNGNLPRFIVMSLGEDHTDRHHARHLHPPGLRRQQRPGPGPARRGGHARASTGPRRRSSSSRTTPRTAPTTSTPTGPSAWSSARTPSAAALDSTQYSTVSMLRTMELILGPPAPEPVRRRGPPMFASFTDKPDLTPYTAEPARIDLNAGTPRWPTAPSGSRQMDFSEYDKIDDFELNEILWHAVKGKDAPLPPAVRRAIAYRGVPQRPLSLASRAAGISPRRLQASLVLLSTSIPGGQFEPPDGGVIVKLGASAPSSDDAITPPLPPPLQGPAMPVLAAAEGRITGVGRPSRG